MSVYVYTEGMANMKRTELYLTEEQREALLTIAQQTGRSMAELVREAIDEWLEKEKTPASRGDSDVTKSN